MDRLRQWINANKRTHPRKPRAKAKAQPQTTEVNLDDLFGATKASPSLAAAQHELPPRPVPPSEVPWPVPMPFGGMPMPIPQIGPLPQMSPLPPPPAAVQQGSQQHALLSILSPPTAHAPTLPGPTPNVPPSDGNAPKKTAPTDDHACMLLANLLGRGPTEANQGPSKDSTQAPVAATPTHGPPHVQQRSVNEPPAKPQTATAKGPVYTHQQPPMLLRPQHSNRSHGTDVQQAQGAQMLQQLLSPQAEKPAPAASGASEAPLAPAPPEAPAGPVEPSAQTAQQTLLSNILNEKRHDTPQAPSSWPQQTPKTDDAQKTLLTTLLGGPGETAARQDTQPTAQPDFQHPVQPMAQPTTQPSAQPPAAPQGNANLLSILNGIGGQPSPVAQPQAQQPQAKQPQAQQPQAAVAPPTQDQGATSTNPLLATLLGK